MYRIYRTIENGSNRGNWIKTSYIGEEKIIKKILISLKGCKNTKFCMRFEN